MAVPTTVKIPDPMTAPIPREVRLSQPSDFFNRRSGSSASEINWSIFLTRNSPESTRHPPDERDNSRSDSTWRRARPQLLASGRALNCKSSGWICFQVGRASACLGLVVRTYTKATGKSPAVGQFLIMRFSGSAGLNRHVVGNERVLQERSQRLHLGPQSCRRHREMPLEA